MSITSMKTRLDRLAARQGGEHPLRHLSDEQLEDRIAQALAGLGLDVALPAEEALWKLRTDMSLALSATAPGPDRDLDTQLLQLFHELGDEGLLPAARRVCTPTNIQGVGGTRV